MVNVVFVVVIVKEVVLLFGKLVCSAFVLEFLRCIVGMELSQPQAVMADGVFGKCMEMVNKMCQQQQQQNAVCVCFHERKLKGVKQPNRGPKIFRKKENFQITDW